LLRNISDSLSNRYAELLSDSYDCMGRIVLNAFFRMGACSRRLPGVVAGAERIGGDVDNKHLARAWQAVSAAAFTVMRKQIAFRFCIVRPGSVSMSSREEYLARTDIREGVFLILVSRADPNEHSGEPRPRQSLPADL